MRKPRAVIAAYDRLQAARTSWRAERAIRRIVPFDGLPPDVRDRTLVSRRRVLEGRRLIHRSPLARPEERHFATEDLHLAVVRDVLVDVHHGFASTPDGWILEQTAVRRSPIEAKYRNGTLLRPRRTIEVDRAVINLECGPKNANFYHFWFDSLTKLLWLGEPEVTDAGPKVLTHSRTLAGWQEELLRRALPSDVDLLHVDRDAVVRAPVSLVLPASRDALLDPVHLATVLRWSAAIGPAVGRRDVPERLYVSRRRAKRRRLLNEDEVTALVEAQGFTSVTLEDLPMREQMDLFAGASVIVAQHGAGLTNLIHARPGTRVLEIQSARPDSEPLHYRSLAIPLGLSYANVFCGAEGPKSDARVPLTDLERTLDLLLRHDRTDAGPTG